MFLERLAALEGSGDPLPEMYQRQRVRWALQLDKRGTYRGMIPLTGEGDRSEEGRESAVPSRVRAYGIKPLLLCDRADYALGIPQEGKEDRTKQQHREFVALVAQCAEATNLPEVKAVATFLREGSVPARDRKAIEPGQRVIFEVAGVYPTDLPPVQAFWAQHTRAGGEVGAGSPVMTCLVCGKRKAVERRLPVMIKGIPGGQSSGTALISANSDAFASYGLDEALTSPTCRDCGEAFANGLNGLISDRKSSLRIGESLVWVFWTRKKGGAGFAVDYLSDPQPEAVRALLDGARKGKDATGTVSALDFYATALSASGGRAVVRDHIETATATVQAHLRRWFELQALADEQGEQKPLGIWRLCQALTHDVSKDMPAAVPQALVHAALTGGPIPDRFLHLAVRRNRAEQGLPRARAVLIKMVLVSHPKHGFTQEDLVTMDPENREPAYLCGRLFAELEGAQRAALGDPNSTIRDRYFGTASTAPASVFGHLMKGSQAHLGKLRKERPGAYGAIERRIEEIAALLPPSLPNTLTLRDQAVFSLGYYHQRAFSRAEMRAAKAAKESKNPGEDSDA